MTENNWAIVVGINEYEHLPTDDHLKYAVKDALAMQSFLCDRAQFPADNVLVCCDPQAGGTRRPSRSGLRDLLRHKLQPARGADNFWFFYAGHGIVHNHQDFLLPCDGNPYDLEETALPISFVTDCLRDCEAHNVVLVLDMCRNRTRSSVEDGSRDVSTGMGEQTLEIAREQGLVTLFSCSRGQRSYEIAALEQGAFTHTLLAGLRESTTPRVLEQYLTNQVPVLNRQYGKPVQVPLVVPEPGWKYDRPLLLSAATPFDLSLLATQARDAELDEDYDRAESLWWQVIEADQSTTSDRAGARAALKRIGVKRRAPAQPQPEREPQSEVQPQPETEPLQESGFPGVLTPQVGETEPEPVAFPGIAPPGDALLSEPEALFMPEDDQTAQNSQPEPESQFRQATPLSESSESTLLPGSAHDVREPPVTRPPTPVADNGRLKPIAPPTPPFRLTRRHFLWLGLGSAGVGSAWLVKALQPKLNELQPFDFDVVTVNDKGETISKKPGRAQAFTEDLGNGVALVMVSIPGGSFIMGSPAGEKEREKNEDPQHEVTVKTFCMGKYAVTQAQWKAVAALPQVKQKLDPDPSKSKGNSRPVERVSWNEAVEFCDRLSRKTGKTYRLPSEAEWDYACRAGTTTPFHFGETLTINLANYSSDYTYASEPKGASSQGTTNVGKFLPNAFGLYDMHGNVEEWCADHWHDNYQGAPTDGSAWLTDNPETYRLLRGGSWGGNPARCRSACRVNDLPGERLNAVGFRVVCAFARTP